MPEEPRLDEQFVSQAIQLGLSSQLSNAEDLKVDVRTDLLKIVQGQADSVSVRGQGMVVQDLRLDEMELHTQELDLNALSLLLGKLELDKPLNATSRVVLTEADVNQAMNNPAIVNRIPPFKFQIDGQTVAIVLQPPIKISFPGQGKIAIDATAQAAEQGKLHHIRFSATAYPKMGDRPVLLESFQCHGGGAVSLDLMLAMMQRVKELMELPSLQYEGIAFRIREMKAEVGRLVLQLETHMSQIPFG
jgi:hypothetical protein